jgi:hypothetical protein
VAGVHFGGLVGKVDLAVDGKRQERGTHCIQQPNHRIGVHGGGHSQIPVGFIVMIMTTLAILGDIGS